MPLYRLAACSVLRTPSRNAGIKFTAGHLIRRQSSGAGGPSRGSGALSKIIIGAGVVGGVVGVAGGGVLAYGNYDPVFKNQANEKIPGFASWVDKTADVWVNVTDYFNPKPGDSKKKKEEEEKFVYEYNKAKNKARLDELKKGQPTATDKRSTKGATVPDKKAREGDQEKKSGSTEIATTNKPKSDKAKSKEVAGEDKPKSEVVATKDKSKSKPVTAEENSKSKEEEVTAEKKSVSKEVVAEKKSKSKKVAAEKKLKSEAAAAEEKVEQKTEEGGTLEPQQDTKPGSVPSKPPSPPPSSPAPQVASSPAQQVAATAPSPEGSNVAGQPTQEPSKEEGVATGAEEIEIAEEIEREMTSAVESAVDSPQMGVMLDESHWSFVSDTSKVKEAQQGLTRAWEELYLKLTTTYSDDGHREKAVAEAKGAASVAHTQLKEAARSYDKSSRKLKELLQRAPAEGFMAKAGDIASDVQLREAEVDLGMVIVKEAVASAAVMEGYGEAIQESKDKLQKDLEAASALIDPERKDSLLLSLNKKVELLDSKLKEIEIDHAQKIALALEMQRRTLEELTRDKIEHVVKESKAKYKSELVKEINKISARYNGMLREQLRLENESHGKEMTECLKDQAEELGSEWSAQMDVKLSEQQGFYQIELARAKARLHGLEVMVEGVASAGEKTLQLQALRNSCATLTSALDSVNLEYDVTKRYNIASELGSLRQVAGDDPFIAVILDSIPSEAVDGLGIQSETSLKERFVKVKRICKRVALVPKIGGGLGTYAISYLQSLLTLHAWLPKEASEDTDLSELHVYNLLHLAEARLKKGDLEGAVHYMNYLQGDSKNVAKDWIVDSRVYLETRQAIQLIQAYISANAAVFTPAQ